jgi:hypothetical protein
MHISCQLPDTFRDLHSDNVDAQIDNDDDAALLVRPTFVTTYSQCVSSHEASLHHIQSIN